MNSPIKQRKQRVFFALWPDAAVVTALTALQRRYVPAQGRSHHPADLHMTLHFLGMLEPPRMQGLVNLVDVDAVSAFDLQLELIDCWPGPAVLCCGPRKVPPQLQDLHRLLAESLLGAGFALESRPYRPHVTLARKVSTGRKLLLHEPVLWRVRRLALVVSETTSSAPRYRVFHDWILKN